MRRLVRRVGMVVIGILDTIFPGPTDDTMALAEAVGVTPPAPTEEELLAAEQRDYHVAMCTAVEGLAEARLAVVGLQDFTFWSLELPSRGER